MSSASPAFSVPGWSSANKCACSCSTVSSTSSSSSSSCSSGARNGLDCDCDADADSILSTLSNLLCAFSRGVYAVDALDVGSSTRSLGARGVTSPRAWWAGVTTKRFAGVSFLNCCSGAAFGVCALMAWRRLDLGFAWGVGVVGGGPAMKRCGEGFWTGIVGAT